MHFAVEVAVRWSDMDAYGHVNHARTVTLLEDARTELLFNEMSRRGQNQFTEGVLVARLSVDYLLPLVYSGEPVLIEMWVGEIRAASFVLHYMMRGRADRTVLVTAETLMVPYDIAASRPRRLTAVEREYLALWTVEDPARA